MKLHLDFDNKQVTVPSFTSLGDFVKVMKKLAGKEWKEWLITSETIYWSNPIYISYRTYDWNNPWWITTDYSTAVSEDGVTTFTNPGSDAFNGNMTGNETITASGVYCVEVGL